MAQNGAGRFADVLAKHEAQILEDWVADQRRASGGRSLGRLSEAQMREEAAEFLRLLRQAVQQQAAAGAGGETDTDGPGWDAVREFLAGLSRSRARQGFSPTETAAFVFSLKQALFAHLAREAGGDADVLFAEVWQATTLLDQLGLYTTTVFQKSREEVIARQQEELMELSTPVVKLWDGILAVPLIGTLDSARTQVVMESLLQAIVDTGSAIAIIDITGVPTVDTLVSQHLLKTVAAARLMGAECIISGIRPQIAQTIVHLGVDLSQVSTKASLADAFLLALQKTGRGITRGAGAGVTSGAGPAA
jgi:Anti-anti-sigma regulatory factor (antagonist of anti-sigma factor)